MSHRSFGGDTGKTSRATYVGFPGFKQIEAVLAAREPLVCKDCGTTAKRLYGGSCSECYYVRKRARKGDKKAIAKLESLQGTYGSGGIEAVKREKVKAAAARMPLTTEATIGEVERLGVVATEVVLGMNIFRDVLANVRDVFGGRSGVVQKTLEEAREAAFEDLRIKAAELGADAVIALDIDYHSISTGSAVNMMMVAVSGTAVRNTRPGGLADDQ